MTSGVRNKRGTAANNRHGEDRIYQSLYLDGTDTRDTALIPEVHHAYSRERRLALLLAEDYCLPPF